MRSELFKVCAIALICVITAIIVRQMKGELSFAVRIAGSLIIVGVVVVSSGEVINDTVSQLSAGSSAEYIQIMVKALGVAFLTHITSSICKDCGEATLSGGVELAGKVEILILCLPIIRRIMEYVSEMVAMGE